MASCVQRDDWCAVVGDRIRRVYQFLTDGDPWPVESVEGMVREKPSDADPALVATCTALDEEAGVWAVEFDGSEGRGLVDGDTDWEGVFDIQVTEAGQSLPETIVAGAFILTPDVTRA